MVGVTRKTGGQREQECKQECKGIKEGNQKMKADRLIQPIKIWKVIMLLSQYR